MPHDRSAAAARGRRAEAIVVRYLETHGYRILGKNVRVGHLEVDIVAQQGSVVCIVEVRHRGVSSFEGPFESISEGKQRRLREAAERLWDTRFAQDPAVQQVRLDVAAVDFVEGREEVEYLEGEL